MTVEEKTEEAREMLQEKLEQGRQKVEKGAETLERKTEAGKEKVEKKLEKGAETAEEKATEAKEGLAAAKQEGADLIDKAKEKIAEGTETLKEKARDLAGKQAPVSEDVPSTTSSQLLQNIELVSPRMQIVRMKIDGVSDGIKTVVQTRLGAEELYHMINAITKAGFTFFETQVYVTDDGLLRVKCRQLNLGGYCALMSQNLKQQRYTIGYLLDGELQHFAKKADLFFGSYIRDGVSQIGPGERRTVYSDPLNRDPSLQIFCEAKTDEQPLNCVVAIISKQAAFPDAHIPQSELYQGWQGATSQPENSVESTNIFVQ